MVVDKIKNLGIYSNISARLAKGIEYINNTDFSKIDLGTYKIEGDDVFAMVQEYDTRNIEDCKLEGHQKYIDIQYIISGDEKIGLTTLNNQPLIEQNDEGDYSFYKGESTLIKFEAGTFGIFFPDDLHMPCVKLNEISKVRKVVVKVRA